MANVSKKKKVKLIKLTLEKHIEPNFLQLLFLSQKRQNLLKTNHWWLDHGHEPCGELSKYGVKFNIMKYVSH